MQSLKLVQTTDSYAVVTLEHAIRRNQIRQAAHCALFFTETIAKRDENRSQITSDSSAYILMQMRSDGKIGFPGGYIDETINDYTAILVGLNRELKEEIDYSEEPVKIENYVCSHYLKSDDEPLIVHFFCKELSKQQFERIEKSHTNAIHFPSESLGLFRFSLFTDESQLSQFWNNFISNHFAGNSKDQLLITLFKVKLINEQQFKALSLFNKCSI